METVRPQRLRAGWAVRLPAAGGQGTGRFRLASGVEAREAGGFLWLRGHEPLDGLERWLDLLPGAQRYSVDSEGRLTPVGCRLPVGRLPAGRWQPLSEWLLPLSPVASSPALPERQVELTLVRSELVEEPAVWIGRLAALHEWAMAAASARLARLRFAASGDGAACVLGRPLPPVEGSLLVEREGIAVPCGWRWLPAVGPTVLRRVLGLVPGDLGILGLDGSFESIDQESMLPLTRAALRRTLRELTLEESSGG